MKQDMEQSRRRRRRRTTLVVTSLYITVASPVAAWNARKPLRYRQTRQQKEHIQWNHASATTATTTTATATFRKPASALAMSARPHISVSIDQPLISDTLFPPGGRGNMLRPVVIMKTLLSLLSLNVVRFALVSLCVALLVSVTMKFSDSAIASTLQTAKKMVLGQVERLVERFRSVDPGVPMPFTADKNGWGVCTLRSKRRLGKSSFVQYDFDLPESDYVLPLELGQQISLCCLDNESSVAKGDFFPYFTDSNPKPGSFSILAPNRSPDAIEFALGQDGANFVRVLKQDMKVGDEIALRPGKKRLSYRGQYLPVTDMVYIACGTGVVPVLDQVRAVLPNGSSSVKSVTVVWINEGAKDFDVTAELLEKEYFKYSTKLAVSCVVDDLLIHSVKDNAEINGVVPTFQQGTMAVLAGPEVMTKKAAAYLQDRGYPEDTICVL